MDKRSAHEAIRDHYGVPHALALGKAMSALDRHAAAFIALSPFLVMASSDGNGRSDASPRGDAPGFVSVLDRETLLVPDRPGNRRVDTMHNIVENPNVGLLFMVPGLIETLRVNGRARFTTDAASLHPLSVNGKAPVAGLLVTVEEVFFHCGKALIRSSLWAESSKVDRAHFPSLGQILADQIAGADRTDAERAVEEGYRDRLY